jgi:class 3 adenylate cyclase
MSAMKACDMVDRLYQQFDALSLKYDVFKIDVVGDAYMATTNLVKDQSDDHVSRLAQFSIEAMKTAGQTLIDVDDPSKGFVQIRIGFHTGPVISDVVGSRLPKYSVFGDSVNTASRMESSSTPGRIQCSSTSAKILKKQNPAIRTISRGSINIKGKGSMKTYWIGDPIESSDAGSQLQTSVQGLQVRVVSARSTKGPQTMIEI